MEGAYIEFKTI